MRTGNTALGLALATALGLSACSKPESEPAAESGAEATASPVPAATASPSASATPVAANAIPEGMHGAWGINAADCDTSRGDAKGNMVVSANSLKFYESVAKLGAIETVTAQMVRAQYDFSGEGQTWQQGVQLGLSADGKTLVRRDFGPDAMPEPLTYQRCL